MTQTERVHMILKNAGGFWTSAQQITEQTGITRVAARIHDLKQAGVNVEAKFVNRDTGKSYRLAASERIAAEPQDETVIELFPTNTSAPKCAIDDDWEDVA